MKTQLIKLIVKATLLGAMMILPLGASAQAQSLADRPRFNIPFDFAFGGKQLPAGEYSFVRALATSGDIMLSLTDRNGRSKVIVLSHATMRLRPTSKASLVFHRYGDQYFLAQVWPAGAEIGREFSKSKSERDIQAQQHLSEVRIPSDR